MKNLVLHVALFVVFILLAPVAGWGQGWERVYDFGEEGWKVIEMQDSNFMVAAVKDAGGFTAKLFLSKIGRRGEIFWTRPYELGRLFPQYIYERKDSSLIVIMIGLQGAGPSVKEVTEFWSFSNSGDFEYKKQIKPDGVSGAWLSGLALKPDTLIVYGHYWGLGTEKNPFIGKINFSGDLVWQRKMDYVPIDTLVFPPKNVHEEFTSIEIDIDGSFWVQYRKTSPVAQEALMKLNTNGDIILSIPLDTGFDNNSLEFSGSSIVIASSQIMPFPNPSFLQKIDRKGKIVSSKNISSPFFSSGRLLRTQDGGFVMLTSYYPELPIQSIADIYLVKFDSNLNWLWDKRYSRGTSNLAYDIIETGSGGFLLVGGTYSFSPFSTYLIRTDSLGNSITNLIAGQVQWDQDKDCIEQPADPGLKNWIVTAASPTDTFYRSTAPDGSYALRVDTGHYTVRVRPLNSLWDTDCSVLDTVLVQMFDTIQHNFPVRATVDCPGMEVSTVVARLRPCFPANLQVWWCNNGTIAAEEAQIQLVLNEHMTYDSASLAPSLVSGDTLWFDLDTVQPFECGNFFVRVLVDCDTALLGQTLCYTAHAYPDTTCLPPSEWSGAQVVTTGYCEGDSVRLVLRNIGSAPTAQGLEYIIVEDNVIMLQAPFWLPPGDSIILKVKANGSTWRLIAQQEPGFPHGFFSTVALEGCHGGASFSTGFVNQFPSGDAAPWLDEECRVVTGSYDPNDKSAVPEGYGEQHFVMANTDLEYLIRFQNTGTDTAFRVVIRDQISPYIDPASVQPGAASHAYTWSLSGTGELVFTFDPIALPDSGANLAASQGFVQFRIAQQPNLPQNTRFENRAAIYFDFNAPVITNTVFHTIQPLFKPTSSVEPPVFAAGEKLKVWPNPANEVAYISFKDKALSPRKLSLYDLSGHLVSVAFSSENTVAVQRGGLPAGMYLVKVETHGERTQVGAVVFR